ncbi:DUF1538 domain-containing protein [Desulfovibrio sp. OttesenSCG-928-G15]|nr:DUF1538 domain-containing protein [Desulfovibrio sp. OttesenSCG-928-G15]
MILNFAEKLKESFISVAPVMLLVIFTHLFLAPLSDGQFIQFLVGGVLLIVGLGIFLMGADIGMVPFGQRVGSALTRKRNLPMLVTAAFIIGFAITIAEPDVQVLANQVSGACPDINKTTLLIMIAVGVGLFLVLGAVRTVMQLPLRWLLIFFYGLVFAACAFVDPAFIGIAFDSGGATTGPITVPFIMAMGLGIAATIKKSEGDDSSFGMVGLASVGPIAAVAALGLISGANVNMAAPVEDMEVEVALPLVDHFLSLLPHIVYEMFMALAPLLVIFLFFQFTLLRLPAQQVKRMILGLLYALIGLIIFMTGVNGGFSPAGLSLGQGLGELGGGGKLLPLGFVLGAVVVLAEPAVWVLTQQVEDVSGGYIRRSIMLAALSLSIALAVTLGMIRVISGMSIWYMLLPGYGLALGLTFFCPKLFTAIAFDSGGVASGPMSTTFVLSLTLGASIALGGNPLEDAFGMIAMIAMAPLITIQILGIAVKIMEKRNRDKIAAKGKAQ